MGKRAIIRMLTGVAFAIGNEAIAKNRSANTITPVIRETPTWRGTAMYKIRNRKKLLHDILGGIIIVVCLLGFAWWATAEYQSNYEQVQGMAANHINDICGDTLVAPMEISIDEGTSVWYIFAPITRNCKRVDNNHLWTMNR